MSKGLKGEKSLKKIINKEKMSEDEKHTYIGALEVNHLVKVKLNGEMKICKIIAVRQDPEREKNEKPNEYSYEYYIHYIDFDRRNDHWIKRENILETDVIRRKYEC